MFLQQKPSVRQRNFCAPLELAWNASVFVMAKKTAQMPATKEDTAVSF